MNTELVRYRIKQEAHLKNFAGRASGQNTPRAQATRDVLRSADEAALAILISEGNEMAFNELYRRFHRQLVGLAMNFLGVRSSAEDVVQTTLFKLYICLTEKKKIHNVRNFTFAICANLCRDELERIRNKRKFIADRDESSTWIEENTEDSRPNPLDQLIIEEDRESVARALSRLTPYRRQVLQFHAIDGLKHRVISQTLGISIGAAKMTTFRAKEDLRKTMTDFKKSAN